MIDVTEVYVDPECDRIYPGRRSGVAKISLKDGRVLEERVLDPKGEGENPMTDDDLTEKFIANCESIVGRERSRQLIEAVWRMDRGADLSVLYRW